MASTKLIVGLGTPGRPEKNNRHSIGFQCVDQYANRHRTGWQLLGQTMAEVAEVRAHTLMLAKPLTRMNDSGEAVSLLVVHFQVDLANMLIIYDDFDLPTGKVRIKPKGSAGGHKGVQSIIQHVGSGDFTRIKIGIGRPPAGISPVEYAMENISPYEEQILGPAREKVCDIIEQWVLEGIEAAMNKYNVK